jgi:uncharacterized membrane protein
MPDDDAFSVSRIIAGLGLGFALGIMVPVVLVSVVPRISQKSAWTYPIVNGVLLGFVIWVTRAGYGESGFVRGLIIALAIMSSLSVICGGILFFVAR